MPTERLASTPTSIFELPPFEVYTHEILIQDSLLGILGWEGVELWYLVVRIVSFFLSNLLHIKPFTDLTAAEVYEILKARCEVFLCEQRICYLDQDNIDYRATHFSLRRKGIVIAYARLFKDTEKGTYRVGRMLSKERGQGYGRYLMDQIIAVARQLGAEKLSLHAQLPVVSFYEQFGYEAVGEAFQEAGMDHQKMVLTL